MADPRAGVGRGRPAPIRDPAIAIAAAKCWVWRWKEGALTINSSFHPKECGFCDYPPEMLIIGVTEFIGWAGLLPPTRFDPANPTAFPVRSQLEAFLTLPASEQARQVQKAQGYIKDEDEDE